MYAHWCRTQGLLGAQKAQALAGVGVSQLWGVPGGVGAMGADVDLLPWWPPARGVSLGWRVRVHQEEQAGRSLTHG